MKLWLRLEAREEYIYSEHACATTLRAIAVWYQNLCQARAERSQKLCPVSACDASRCGQQQFVQKGRL